MESPIDNMSAPKTFNLVILFWNYCGLGNEHTLNAMRDLVYTHHLDVLVITKT